MLSMTDTPIEHFIQYFADTGVPVAFLVPTPNGYGKSIMDATSSVRRLLLEAGVHNYELQGQGPVNKVLITSHFVNANDLTNTTASLYRPVTKKGDPRIWFARLREYCRPCNLLALIVKDKEIYVFNLSKADIAYSLRSKGFVYSILQEASHRESAAVADELLSRLRDIHRQGFFRSITPGDPGVGDTLEHALGIDRNNSRDPDYKGIELKATRLTRNGRQRVTTRSNLFTQVPHEGMKYREIVEHYGKIQVPRGQTIARLQLYDTFSCLRVNAYDLTLNVDENTDKLNMSHKEKQLMTFVSAWILGELRKVLLRKHPETFWVKAVSESRNGVEYFRYDKVLHTKNPNASLFAPLLEAGKITVDLAAHFEPDGKFRNHGILFKMLPDDLSLLLGEPKEYIL